MKKKRPMLKDMLFLSISSFIVVVAWIGFNLYHSFVTTTITPDLQVQITPIDPNFDMITLEKLKTRKKVIPIKTLSNTIITEEPAPTVTPENTDSTQQEELQAEIPTPTITLPEASPTQPLQTDIPVTINGQ